MPELQDIGSVDPKLRYEFLIVEYQKAADAYFHGVDICINWIRSFFFINGILLAVIATLAKPDASNSAKSLVNLSVPIVGVVLALALMSFVPFWAKQIRNCRERCKEIELEFRAKHCPSDFKGQLYTRISGTSSFFGAAVGLYLIAGIDLLFWLAVLWVQPSLKWDFVPF